MPADPPPPRASTPWGHLFLLFVAGLAARLAWALTIPWPEDWDATYYRSVAAHLARGEGPVTGALWTLAYVPERLPMPIDLYWMPLPSRVLVPGLWAWPAHGDQLVTGLIGALWVPLAWLLARVSTNDERAPALAALFALAAGPFARVASAPDCYALYGAIGAGALLAVEGRRWALAAALAGLAALTRADGFLFGLALGLGFRGWQAFAVAVTGPALAATWAVRGFALGGDGYLASRRIAASATDYLQVIEGRYDAPLSIAGRFAEVLRAAPDLVEYAVTPGLLVLLPASLVGAWSLRDRPWVAVVAVWFAVLPLITVFAAPAVALHGTLYRSGAGLFVGVAVLAAVGVSVLARSLGARRGYPPWFLPGLHVAVFAVISVGVGALQAASAQPPVACALLDGVPPGEPVFTSDPLGVEARCGRTAVVVTRTLTPSRAADLAERFGICSVLVAPPDLSDEGSLGAADVPRVLPGWTPTSDRVWRDPACPD